MNLQIIILCCIQQGYKIWKMTILYKKKHDNYEKYIKLGNKLTNKPLIKFLDKKSLLNLLRLH